MPRPRKQFSSTLKARVALEAIRGEKTPATWGKVESKVGVKNAVSALTADTAT